MFVKMTLQMNLRTSLYVMLWDWQSALQWLSNTFVQNVQSICSTFQNVLSLYDMCFHEEWCKLRTVVHVTSNCLLGCIRMLNCWIIYCCIWLSMKGRGYYNVVKRIDVADKEDTCGKAHYALELWLPFPKYTVDTCIKILWMCSYFCTILLTVAWFWESWQVIKGLRNLNICYICDT